MIYWMIPDNSQSKQRLMHKSLYIFLVISTLSLLFSSGCKKGTSLSETDFKEMYSTHSEVPQPFFQVYHSSSSTSDVYCMLENKSLTYSTESTSNTLIGRIRIGWQLYSDYSSKTVLDSSSFVMIDTIASSGFKQLQCDFKVPMEQGSNYILKITVTNLNNNLKSTNFIHVNKTDKTNRQFFKVMLIENNSVLFRNYFYPNEKLRIIYGGKKSDEILQGKHFETNFPVAAPPFSYTKPAPFDFNAHTKFTVQMTRGEAEFSNDKPGIYHFGFGEENNYTGLTLFQYSDQFPHVNTPEEMLSPLRFITSKKEFEKLQQYQDSKKAVDEFWLTTSKEPEKAKKLVKGFYSRVQNANYFFSSYKEGWKTDRGVIYIVFGPPSIVYRNLTGESWTYGEESNYRSLTFNFSLIDNPFTNNDYTLERTTVYKNPWYRAVDSWRQGKVASLEY